MRLTPEREFMNGDRRQKDEYAHPKTLKWNIAT